jgi:hypothetical protein
MPRKEVASSMTAPRKCSDEVRERAMGLVRDGGTRLTHGLAPAASEPALGAMVELPRHSWSNSAIAGCKRSSG